MSEIFTAKDMKDAAMAGNQVPKCASWLGHKFEARYSSEPNNALAGFRADAVLSADLPLLLTKRTYECDICVRCGFVVEHKTEKSSSESID